ncbi:MAG: amidohydrolase family protein, partial [Nitratireductor sp.]|nr:amidohydrolase family protein [Nitratireductor sp.]
MNSQVMDPDWLVFHPSPKKPDFVLPTGAVDAHCHVFGPSAQFPFAPERKYTPCDAGKDKLFELRDFLGFQRNVIVQATCHGKDNRAMVDAVKSSNGLARGIASVGKDISVGEIEEMDAAGVRGVRFNFVKRLVDATPKEVFLAIADRIKEFGWHIVVY